MTADRARPSRALLTGSRPLRTGRGRVVRTLTVLLAVLLFAVAVGLAEQAAHRSSRESLDHGLLTDAAANAAAIAQAFERARTVDLLLADDSAFRSFAPGSTVTPAERRTLTLEAAGALQYLEALYPDQVSEACLIDSTGTEIARVVRGVVAPDSELSTDEADNPFFAPTLALPAGRVYQAAPYLSDDTHQWVVSSATPLVAAGGQAWALVHFEVSLSSLSPVQGEEHGRTVSVVDHATGRVLLVDGRPVTDGRLGVPGSTQLRTLVAGGGAARAADVDGRRAAVVQVPRLRDEVNDWSVVVSTAPPPGGLRTSLSPTAASIALAALLLLLLAWLNLRNSQQELRTASFTDELTGLPNRRLLTDRLEQALLQNRRRGTTCGVLLLDLDRFKEVNDTLGHHHGDLLLQAVTTRLLGIFRDSDTVGRLGGDEFAVLLPDVGDEQTAVELAERCVTGLQEPFVVDGVSLSVEASIGVALAPHHGTDGETLLRVADVAMYEAKERRCGVSAYDPDLDVHTPTRLALLGDLRRALADDELVLHYQPKVDLDTGSVRGVEALVRWEHPERGLVPPDEFIPAAEGTGLILPLTLRTLQLAVAQARQWVDAGSPLQVAVNLSPRCLLEPAFATRVQEVLDEHGLPARLLRLEVTESTIMADPARALGVLAALQASGISLSIDDFGTGYSSMSYLKRLPVDELKIDRSFVMDMIANSGDNVLVRSSIDLGHNLGLTVVAEGVEDEETVSALAELGCDVLQGYHLARPMTATAFGAWLRARASSRA